MQGCPKGTCFGLADIVGGAIFAYQKILNSDEKFIITSLLRKIKTNPNHFRRYLLHPKKIVHLLLTSEPGIATAA